MTPYRLLVVLLLVLAGCGGTDASAPPPSPSATDTPTATAPPTATPSPTTTAWPTAAPSPTATARPTATPSPTVIAQSTATASPTAGTSAPELGNFDAFPDDTDNDGQDNDVDADDDSDGVPDADDNCAILANDSQLDTDSDGQGDACDLDDDGDGYVNELELITGSNPLNTRSTPEVFGYETTCSDAIDNDQDGLVDADDDSCIDTDGDTAPDSVDNCPTISNYGWRDQDDDGIGDACDDTVDPVNQPPDVDGGGPYNVPEGGSMVVTASGSDPDGDALTFYWDLNGDLIFDVDEASATFDAAQLDGPMSRGITVAVTDGRHQLDFDHDQIVINVQNVAPTIEPIVGPSGTVTAGTTVTVSATFADPGVSDTHSAVWDWGDGTTSTGTVAQSAGSGSAVGSHTYMAPGTYTITLTVTDDDDGAASAVTQVVIDA